MDWKTQTDDMVKSWSEMQNKMWSSWLEAIKDFSPAQQSGDAWQQEYSKHLAGWEESVQSALEKQMEWTQNWADKVSQEQGTPEVVSQWASQVQDMMKGWTEAQHQLWGAWFESVKSLDPSQVTVNWEKEGQQVMDAWKNAAESAQKTMADWAKMSGFNKES